jgi:hypothetical protein
MMMKSDSWESTIITRLDVAKKKMENAYRQWATTTVLLCSSVSRPIVPCNKGIMKRFSLAGSSRRANRSPCNPKAEMIGMTL